MKWVSTDIRESDVPRSTSARRVMVCEDEVKLYRTTVVAPSLTLKCDDGNLRFGVGGSQRLFFGCPRGSCGNRQNERCECHVQGHASSKAISTNADSHVDGKPYDQCTHLDPPQSIYAFDTSPRVLYRLVRNARVNTSIVRRDEAFARRQSASS
jgi:hypothetical protein